MIIARVARGITTHFVTRMHEWIFSSMLIGMGLQLLRVEESFKLPVYEIFKEFADEDTWGRALVIAGSIRFLALIINGTFPHFHTITPLIRAFLAFLSAFVWFALAWGFWKFNPSALNVIAFSGLMFLDIASSLIIAREAGSAKQRYTNGCRAIG